MFFVKDITETEKQRHVQSKRLKAILGTFKTNHICIAVLKEIEIDCKVETF